MLGASEVWSLQRPLDESRRPTSDVQIIQRVRELRRTSFSLCRLTGSNLPERVSGQPLVGSQHMAYGRCAALLFQQLLNIAQRKRRAKLPPGRTEYEAGFSLRPFEDCGSGYYFAILSRHQPATLKVATHPSHGFKPVLGAAVPLFKCMRENKEWGPPERNSRAMFQPRVPSRA